MIEIVLLVLLLGIFTPLIIMYSLFGFSRDYRHWKRYLWIGLIFVFILSYNYHPAGKSDLTRYVEWINTAKNYSLLSYIDFMADSLYVSNFLFWVAGNLGMPYLVPAFTTTVIYGVTIYITCDFSERNNVQSLIPYVVIIQILLLPYVSILNNVRNVFAFSLVILAAYRDIYQNKRNIATYVLYFLSLYVHKTSFVLVSIRLLSILAGKYLVLSLVVAFLIPSILNLSFPYISLISSYGTVGKILGDALLTGYRSMVSTSSWAITVMTGRYYLLNRYFSYTVSGIFLLIASTILRKIRFLDNLPLKRYIYFLSLMCIFTIATNVFRTPVYWRFFAAVVITSGPILVQFLLEKDNNHVRLSQIWLMLFALGVFFLTLQIYGSIRDVNYNDWVYSLFLNPSVRIIYDFVLSFFRL